MSVVYHFACLLIIIKSEICHIFDKKWWLRDIVILVTVQVKMLELHLLAIPKSLKADVLSWSWLLEIVATSTEHIKLMNSLCFLPWHQIVACVFFLSKTWKEKIPFYFRCLPLSHCNSLSEPPSALIPPLSQPLYPAQVTFLGLTDMYHPRAYLFPSTTYCYVSRWPFDALPLQWTSDMHQK